MSDETKKRIESFVDLDAWQEGHKFVLLIYDITKQFPGEELFGLTIQLRRAAVSITSNIAEGFSRRSYREKLQFYSIALGSVTEAQNQLMIATDIHYISPQQFNVIMQQAIMVHKIINGLIKHSKTIIHNS